MTPFWYLTIGLGLAWFVVTGRANAVVKAISPSITFNRTAGIPCPDGCGYEKNADGTAWECRNNITHQLCSEAH